MANQKKRPKPIAEVQALISNRRSPTYSDLLKVVRYDRRLGKRLRFNEMSHRPELWAAEVNDHLLSRVREAVSDAYVIDRGDEELCKALSAVAKQNPHHPVRAYLNDLTWDGKQRIRKVMSSILRCPDEFETRVHQNAVQTWFVGAVARVMKPGCKMDTVLTLVGAQGAGKSTFFKDLGSPWYADSYLPIGSKDAFLGLHRSWIHELSEGDGILRRTSQDRLKSFISSQEDIFRVPYGRTVETMPRHSILVATTNEAEFLKDMTGSRRFWIFKVGDRMNLQPLRKWRDQLWAEAVHNYRAGKPWHLSKGDELQLQQLNEQFVIHDPWVDLIPEVIVKLGGPDRIFTNDLLAELPGAKYTSGLARRAAGILKKMGWIQRNGSIDGRTGRYWMAP